MKKSALLNYIYAKLEAWKAEDGVLKLTAGDGRYFFSAAEGYGTVEYNQGTVTLTLLGGRLSLAAFSVGRAIASLTVDGRAVDFNDENGCAAFERTAIAKTLVATVK